MSERCERCGHDLETVRRPLRRLRWTRYWWEGLKSLFTGPLAICGRCGAMYASDGTLLAAGAVETETEYRLSVYRRDMAYIRDAFGAVTVASAIVVAWLIVGPESVALTKVVLGVAVGAAALAPFTYFARRAHLAGKQLKAMREARRRGTLPSPHPTHRES